MTRPSREAREAGVAVAAATPVQQMGCYVEQREDSTTVEATAPASHPSIETSPAIGKLASALAKAQALMRSAPKNRINPHFKSRYADLDAVSEAIRGPLSQHGLALLQPLSSNGDPRSVVITTVLVHESGEWLRSSLTLQAAQATPQAIGAAVTYGRRYSAAAIVGIASDEDDDGEAAEGRPAAAAARNGNAHAAESRPPVESAPRYQPPPQQQPGSQPDWLQGLPGDEPANKPGEGTISEPQGRRVQAMAFQACDLEHASKDVAKHIIAAELSKRGYERMGQVKRGEYEHFVWSVLNAIHQQAIASEVTGAR